MFKSGDVILTRIQFADTYDIKTRPVLVLFEELGNLVVAGITSNLNMKGISLTKEDGAVKESVIKLNYIFTISNNFVVKKLFSLNSKKKKQVFEEFVGKLSGLKR